MRGIVVSRSEWEKKMKKGSNIVLWYLFLPKVREEGRQSTLWLKRMPKKMCVREWGRESTGWLNWPPKYILVIDEERGKNDLLSEYLILISPTSWLNFLGKVRLIKDGGRVLIGWSKSKLLRERYVSEGRRWSIGLLKWYPKERWVREDGRVSTEWLNSLLKLSLIREEGREGTGRLNSEPKNSSGERLRKRVNRMIEWITKTKKSEWRWERINWMIKKNLLMKERRVRMEES